MTPVAQAPADMDPPTPVDLLFRTDLRDLLAVVVAVPARRRNPRHRLDRDRGLWAAAGSGHHHPLLRRLADRVASRHHLLAGTRSLLCVRAGAAGADHGNYERGARRLSQQPGVSLLPDSCLPPNFAPYCLDFRWARGTGLAWLRPAAIGGAARSAGGDADLGSQLDCVAHPVVRPSWVRGAWYSPSSTRLYNRTQSVLLCIYCCTEAPPPPKIICCCPPPRALLTSCCSVPTS